MMRKRRLVTAIVGVAALLVVLFAIVISNSNSGPRFTKDEIGLQIQLDINEDIGLVIINSNINGETESGGISNVNGSLIKKNELLFWSINKEVHESLPETVDLKLQFNIVTKYFQPNFENIYPEEYVKITGDKVNGYKATIEQ